MPQLYAEARKSLGFARAAGSHEGAARDTHDRARRAGQTFDVAARDQRFEISMHVAGGGKAYACSDLTHGRRMAVLIDEGPDEGQDFELLRGEAGHGWASVPCAFGAHEEEAMALRGRTVAAYDPAGVSITMVRVHPSEKSIRSSNSDSAGQSAARMEMSAMSRLRGLRGTGVLKAGGKEIGPISYDLAVYEHRGARSCSGTIAGDRGHIHAAFTAGAASIVRSDTGYEMTIVITSHQFDGRADVEVSGNPGVT